MTSYGPVRTPETMLTIDDGDILNWDLSQYDASDLCQYIENELDKIDDDLRVLELAVKGEWNLYPENRQETAKMRYLYALRNYRKQLKELCEKCHTQAMCEMFDYHGGGF